MEPDRVRPLSEADIDFVIDRAGGRRAHPDADQRRLKGADYRLGFAVIELKALDDEGFAKPERQQKLAALFRAHEPGRPVIVLDRGRLPESDRPVFDRIIERPIKTGVDKANKQLKQSRLEHPDASCSVLLVINNGYTTLDHDSLKELVARRVRNDTTEIDAVVIAGCYYHSDGFNSYFLWPMDRVQINVERPFLEFEELRTAWHDLAERFMTDAMRGHLGPALEKGPVADTQFDIDGVTYVRPAPAIGPSDFYLHGRPRQDSSGLTVCPPVGTVFPGLNRKQWSRLNEHLGRPARLLGTYEAWRTEQAIALASGETLKPVVAVPVTFATWAAWCEARGILESASSVFEFASEQFSDEVRARMRNARERRAGPNLRFRHVAVVTEVVGQDRANDVSHIAIVRVRPTGEALVQPLVENARIFHEHALALGASYAMREGLDAVLWSKNLTYAWI